MAFTLALTNRFSNGLDVTIFQNETGGLFPVWIELCRSPDFSGDDSVFKQAGQLNSAVTAPVSIRGLPAGTTWHVRAVNTTTGQTSNIIVAATAEVALVSAYSGFSVDKSMLVDPVTIASLVDSYGANNARIAGFPPSNLVRDDPQSTYQVLPTADSLLNLTLDFETSGEPVDVIAFLGTLADDNMRWTVMTAPTAAGHGGAGSTNASAMSFRVSPSIGRRQYYHALYQFPTPTTNRFWRVIIQSTGITNHVSFIARQLVVGLARQSTNPSRGHSEGANDTGTFSRGRFGTPDRVYGWRGRSVDFEMSWLRESEYQTKWAPLLTTVGKTKSVLALANGKRNVWTNDRLAFGPITDIRGEVQQSSRHVMGIAIDSLY
jgi:hypothetical protein